MSTVDLNDLPPNATLTIARDETAGEHFVRLLKDVLLFLTAMAFVCTIFGIAVHTALAQAASADAQKWAMSILSLAAGGLTGYHVRDGRR